MADKPKKRTSGNDIKSLLIKSRNREEETLKKLEQLENTNTLLLQQIMNLSKSVYSQNNLIKESEQFLYKELNKFRRVPPQNAWGTMLFKLLGELLQPINQLDELLQPKIYEDRPKEELSWIQALEIIRNQLEHILSTWGCQSIEIQEGKEEFDPVLHQAVEADIAIADSSLPENTILKVVQRGWKINDHILQYPQVVVK